MWTRSGLLRSQKVVKLNADEKFRRIVTELEKLATTHPDLTNDGNTYLCQIYPRRGPARQVSVVLPADYPFVAPKAYVYPFDDLSNMTHIMAEGEICYMHRDEWNVHLHTLSYVFSQAKRIAYEAIMQRYGI